MTKSGKTTKKYWASALLGILLFGVGSFSANAAESVGVHHELVPHVVLPETIQYNKTAKNGAAPFCMNLAADYGMVSPFVATYTPFPSYQLPWATQMAQVGQAVYPVAPAPKALPLPKQKEAEKSSNENELAAREPQEPEKLLALQTTEEKSILLASNNEEIVPATPLSPLNQDITQTGIFCQKPAKPPAAWSFNSPIFKAASVPMPWGGAPGFNGYIYQQGPHGGGSQIGFVPQGGQPGVPGAGGMPYQNFSMGMGGAYNPGGVQTQMLPNGMLLLTAPADHTGCGLIRCRGNAPRMMILPGNPAMQSPGMMPQLPPSAAPPQQPGIPADAAAFYYGNPMGMPQMGLQSALQPVTAMTPYGLTVVGYRPAAAYQNLYQNPFMYGGMGAMPAAQWQALQQMQAQQQSQSQTSPSGSDETSAEGNGEQGGELKAPLPINPQLAHGGLYASPFALYAAQVEAAAAEQAQAMGAANTMGAVPPAPDALNPLFFQCPQFQQPMFYQTPFGLVAAQPSPFGPYGGSYGAANPYSNPYGNSYGNPYGFPQQPNAIPVGFGGYPGQQQGFQQGGMSMSDVVQLMLLLRDNQPRRRGLFARLAERRTERRERNASSDPFAQLMQMWATPFNPDSAMRMPARNAYPYGYFGAQSAPQDTANYGGYYNLYMGSTSYPGLY